MVGRMNLEELPTCAREGAQRAQSVNLPASSSTGSGRTPWLEEVAALNQKSRALLPEQDDIGEGVEQRGGHLLLGPIGRDALHQYTRKMGSDASLRHCRPSCCLPIIKTIVTTESERPTHILRARFARLEGDPLNLTQRGFAVTRRIDEALVPAITVCP